MSGGHRKLLMFVSVSLLTSGQAECPHGGWEESRGSCYLFVSDNRSQVDAQTACNNKGGNLTSVADAVENNFVYNLSLARCGAAACPSVWFGLIKMGNVNTNLKEGWTWLDGSTYDNGDYNKWNYSEPGNGESCARMFLKDTRGVPGEWGGLGCGDTFPYVCKQRATPSTATVSTPTTTTTSATQADCPHGGWEKSRGSCYLFVSDNRSQMDAQTECINQGSNLTSVADEEENNFVYNLSLARCSVAACPSVWFGLTKMGDLNTNSREGWTWLDGSTYDNGNYNKWKVNEPSSGESCARMYVKDPRGVPGEWGGLSCGDTFPYVCKQRATPSTTTVSTPTTTTPTTTHDSNIYIGAGVGVGVVVGIIVVIIVVVIVVKRRNKSERHDVTNSQSVPSGGDGDAGGEGGYSYVEVRPAKIMKELAAEGVYSEANNDAESQDVDTASEDSVTSPPPTIGRPSVTSPSQDDDYANVVKVSTMKQPQNNSIQKSVIETAPKPSDAQEDSKTGVYDNDPSSPTTHKVADSGDEYALVTRSDTGEMTMAPPGGQ